jgi:hypothetical protein
MGTWRVSPKFSNSKLVGGKIEDKIDVFEDQIDGWMLCHARALCSDQYVFRGQAGIAVLTISCPYFEAIESHYVGLSSAKQSCAFFRRGFLRVFSGFEKTLAQHGYSSPHALAEEIADCIYEQLRCGLLHEAATKNKIVIRKDTAPLGFMLEVGTGNVGSIVVDPCLFLNEVDAHFRSYVTQLRDPNQKDLRANFQRFFDFRINRSGAVLPPPVASRG